MFAATPLIVGERGSSLMKKAYAQAGGAGAGGAGAGGAGAGAGDSGADAGAGASGMGGAAPAGATSAPAAGGASSSAGAASGGVSYGPEMSVLDAFLRSPAAVRPAMARTERDQVRVVSNFTNAAGEPCNLVEQSVLVGRERVRATGTLCLQRDGRWVLVH